MSKMSYRPPFKFYLSVALSVAFSMIGYISMYIFINNSDYGNLGDCGIWIYFLSMVVAPVSGFRLLKAVQREFGNNHMAFWAMGFPVLLLIIFLIFDIKANVVIILFFTVYSRMWIPMSWYDFKEGRWNKK